ncbi:MAG: sigma-70 family RNA polymerase sigma factor [Bacteroidota bacterium]
MKLENLLRLCRQKESSAQRELVGRYAPFVSLIAKRYARSTADAKDILQDSLIIIFRKLDQCTAKEEAGFKAWIQRITINTALQSFRKSYRKNEVSTDVIRDHRLQLPEIDSKLHVEDILKLLKFLPDTERQVFNLKVIDGYKHDEIAKMLNIQVSSSRALLTRARQQLQTLLKKTAKMHS